MNVCPSLLNHTHCPCSLIIDKDVLAGKKVDYFTFSEIIIQVSSKSVPNICFVLPQKPQTYPRTKPMKFTVLVAADKDLGTWNHWTKILSTTFILSSDPAVLLNRITT